MTPTDHFRSRARQTRARLFLSDLIRSSVQQQIATARRRAPTPPTLSGGQNGDITTSTESQTGKVVHYEVPTASDLQGSVTVSCSPAPDTNFAVGSTPVTCSADDGRGNSASRNFNVNVTLVDS